MRTEQLIAALSADASRPPVPVRGPLVRWLLAGAAVSALAMLTAMGVRSDLSAALLTWRFVFKIVLVTLALVLAAVDLVRHVSPEWTRFASAASLLVPVLLFGAVAVELLAAPADTWMARAVGTNALVCLVALPLLSLAPLAAGVYALRQGAPGSAATAGAAAGRLAAAVAAVFYAFHCADDSPLFVGLWYVLASGIVIGIGALAGSRLLRW
ncbi:MAG: NrsF family protein [Hyphomicrobiaceae bacterium]